MANKKSKTRPYCKLCTPPHQFSSLSALRTHQRQVHADRWAKTPVVETVPMDLDLPKVTVSRVIRRGPRVPPAAAMMLDGGAAHHLQMALVNYRAERDRLNTIVTQLEVMVSTDGHAGVAPGPVPALPKKKQHKISPEGKAAIAEAQRKRWAKRAEEDATA